MNNVFDIFKEYVFYLTFKNWSLKFSHQKFKNNLFFSVDANKVVGKIQHPLIITQN